MTTSIVYDLRTYTNRICIHFNGVERRGIFIRLGRSKKGHPLRFEARCLWNDGWVRNWTICFWYVQENSVYYRSSVRRFLQILTTNSIDGRISKNTQFNKVQILVYNV